MAALVMVPLGPAPARVLLAQPVAVVLRALVAQVLVPEQAAVVPVLAAVAPVLAAVAPEQAAVVPVAAVVA
ncbi:hypothetical protein J7E70_27635, partial [Variovorax paradoxus]